MCARCLSCLDAAAAGCSTPLLTLQQVAPPSKLLDGSLRCWQVPLEGPLLRGGIAAVLKTREDAWHGRQETGEPRSDFFLPTRQVL
jgi:hypothetical protein